MRKSAILLSAAVSFSRSVAAQPAADVHVPPFEIATAFSYDVQRAGTGDLPGGAGGIVAVDGNFDEHRSLTAQVSSSARMRAVMVGGRLSTGFFRDGAGGPGRFFAEFLAGPRQGGYAGGGAVVQVGFGADALVVPRGVSLHMALDYLFTPGAPRNFAGARVSIGLLVGPCIKSSGRIHSG